MGNHIHDAAVVDDILHTPVRMSQIQRYVDSSGLEYAEETDNPFRGTFHSDTDGLAGYLPLKQIAGYMVTQHVQLLICQSHIFEVYSNPLWMFPNVLLENINDAVPVIHLQVDFNGG
jgi:hypothetical protein